MIDGISRSKARALEAFFGEKELPLHSFSALMRVTEKSARKWLRKLIAEELVKRAEDEEAKKPTKFYCLTDLGRDILQKKPWECTYCREHFFDKRNRPQEQPCRACKKEHRICRKCWKIQATVAGEWPTWNASARTCPGGPREKTKETAQAAAQDGPA